MSDLAPIDMILFCPVCGFIHVDAPEPETGWMNPPHKSHKCHQCEHVWRPADVPTNGVLNIKTRGAGDSPSAGWVTASMVVPAPYAWFWCDGSESGVITTRQDYEHHKATYPRMKFTPVYVSPPAHMAVRGQFQLDGDTASALLAQGLTAQEISAFESTVDSATLTLALPEIHPMDKEEFCSAYHVIQDKILARAAVKAIRGVSGE